MRIHRQLTVCEEVKPPERYNQKTKGDTPTPSFSCLRGLRKMFSECKETVLKQYTEVRFILFPTFTSETHRDLSVLNK